MVDIADPAAPALVTTLSLPGETAGVLVVGDLAYVANSQLGLQIIDIATIGAPVLAGAVAVTGPARSVAVSATLAVVAADWGGLYTVDVSDAAAPQVVGFLDTPGTPVDVTISGSTAYVAAAGGPLRGRHRHPEPPARGHGRCRQVKRWCLAVLDDIILVAASSGGLVVVDPGAGPDPAVIGLLETVGQTSGRHVAGLAYLASGGNLQIVDAADPAAPATVGSLHLSGLPRDVAIADGFVCLALGPAGLATVYQHCPTVTAVEPAELSPSVSILTLQGVRPNPFNPATSIGFELTEPAVVSVRVFDAAGRLVRALASGRPLAAGRHDLTWNGRDDRGRRVGSGVYFLQVRGGDEERIGRAVLVK